MSQKSFRFWPGGLLLSLLTAAPAARAAVVEAPLPTAEVQFPLHTQGQWIVDAQDHRVKLKAVNWYGASDGFSVVGGLDKNSVKNIVQLIRELGFNAVRLPFSNAMLHGPTVAAEHVLANPEFAGQKATTVYDEVVKELTGQGVMVILNNHTTRSVWCCGNDTDSLWFNDSMSTEQWMQDWEGMAQRYATNPLVIGADLRNELRWSQLGNANWGGNDKLDWHLAATTLGNRLYKINPHLLIVVEGLNYATDLTGVQHNPVVLEHPNHVVYSSHNYSWIHSSQEKIAYSWFRSALDHSWGFISNSAELLRAPVWVGEFGAGPNDDPQWFTLYVQYLKEKDLDWCIWPLNVGPTALGHEETWGLLTSDWQRPLADWRVQLLKTIQ